MPKNTYPSNEKHIRPGPSIVAFKSTCRLLKWFPSWLYQIWRTAPWNRMLPTVQRQGVQYQQNEDDIEKQKKFILKWFLLGVFLNYVSLYVCEQDRRGQMNNQYTSTFFWPQPFHLFFTFTLFFLNSFWHYKCIS